MWDDFPTPDVVPPQPAPPVQFFGAETPTQISSNDTNATFGQDLTFTADGNVTVLRYFRTAGVGVAVTATPLKIYSTAGVLLASTTTTGETVGAGWWSATLTTPLVVTAGQTVRLAYEATGTRPYYYTPNTHASVQPRTRNGLTMGANYILYGLGFPAGTASAEQHFVDVTFVGWL